MQNRSADPDTAYRYAKGYPVIHPYHRARIQIHTPLDFLVVSDHGEFMGVLPKLLQGDPMVADTPTGKRYRKMAAAGKEIDVFADLIAQVNKVKPASPDLNNETINRAVWNEIMAAADAHNEPGKFTAFMGWEWTSTPQGANLHRVVIMEGGKENGDAFLPYTSFDSDRPEDLWAWLDETSEATGASFVSIPHNSNISKGRMFANVDYSGEPLTAEQSRGLLLPLLSDGQSETLQRDHQLDACFHVVNDGRYRANIFQDRKGVNGVFRLLPNGTTERGLAIAQIRNKEIVVLDPAPRSFAGAGF